MEATEPEFYREIHEKIGTLGGRVDGIESSMVRMADAMETLARHDTRVGNLEEAKKQHDKRISALEGRCEGRAVRLEALEKHAANDMPVSVYLGNWAVGVLCALAAGLVAYLIPRLPAIIRFLEKI